MKLQEVRRDKKLICCIYLAVMACIFLYALIMKEEENYLIKEIK